MINPINAFHETNYLDFQGKIIEQKRAFLEAAKSYTRSDIKIGAELEIQLLDTATLCPKTGRMSCDGAQLDAFGVLYKHLPSVVDGELGGFNAEINPAAVPLNSNALQTLENTILAARKEIAAVGNRFGFVPYFSGLLETASEKDYCAKNIIALPSEKNYRYIAINKSLMALRGGPYVLELSSPDGVNRYSHKFDSIMPEAGCTSFQQHIQVKEAAEIGPYLNASSILTPSLVAITSNSPFFASQGPFSKESRLHVFKQSIDDRTVLAKNLGCISRSDFLPGYYDKETALEKFLDETCMRPIILPCDIFAKNSGMNYGVLRLQLGTDWRMVRPVWNNKNDITIEYRPLPAGPTTVDMIAASALYWGAAIHLVESGHGEEIRKKLSFDKLREDFNRATDFGMEAKIHWNETSNKVPVRQAIQDILDWAERGFGTIGVNGFDKYLEVIRKRAEKNESPADYKIKIFRDTKARGLSNEEAMKEIVKAGLFHFEQNKPFISET